MQLIYDLFDLISVAPVLNKTVKDTFYWNDSTVEIHCVLLKGNPETKLSWFYHYCTKQQVCRGWQGIDLQYGPFTTIRSNKESQSTLRITPSRFPSHFTFKFKCLAENNLGSDSMEFYLWNVRKVEK